MCIKLLLSCMTYSVRPFITILTFSNLSTSFIYNSFPSLCLPTSSINDSLVLAYCSYLSLCAKLLAFSMFLGKFYSSPNHDCIYELFFVDKLDYFFEYVEVSWGEVFFYSCLIFLQSRSTNLLYFYRKNQFQRHCPH